MAAIKDIRDVFSIFHDGGISAWTGDKNRLTLTIECQYLAERIDKSFNKFYIELNQIDVLFLSTWPNPIDLPVQILTEPSDIFKADLQILSADIEDDKAVITCFQHDTDFDYSGGNLTISSLTISIFDQHKNELKVEQLEKLCEEYWDEWSKQ